MLREIIDPERWKPHNSNQRVGVDSSPETAVANEKLPCHRREHKAKLLSFRSQVGRRQKPAAGTP